MADQQHASSTGGDPAHMPDGTAATVGSLTGNSGLLGQHTGNPVSRQAIPTGDASNTYAFTSAGEPGYLGQDTDDYAAAGLTDSERTTVPDPDLPGAAGTKNAGPQGSPLDWDSVAPYKYPEYPKDSYTANGGGVFVK